MTTFPLNTPRQKSKKVVKIRQKSKKLELSSDVTITTYDNGDSEIKIVNKSQNLPKREPDFIYKELKKKDHIKNYMIDLIESDNADFVERVKDTPSIWYLKCKDSRVNNKFELKKTALLNKM